MALREDFMLALRGGGKGQMKGGNEKGRDAILVLLIT